MKSLLKCLFPFLLLGASSSVLSAVSVIPLPEKVDRRKGVFCFSEKTTFAFENEEQHRNAQSFVTELQNSSGFGFQQSIGKRPKGSVVFRSVSDLSNEAYRLDISPTQIVVEATSGVGFFYAMQTLRQLLPPQIGAGRNVAGIAWEVPSLRIEDSPRFGYRGFMLDVSRYFSSKKEILRLLDIMAMYKINKFHWHLVDDNGWRLEIKKYPLLTSVGGYRVERQSIFPLRLNPQAGEPTPVGGFYTQEEVREIVAYATARHIEVIPEIEMPAHSNAALAAYPELACPVVKNFIGTLPGIGGHNAAIIFCAGNDRSYSFFEDIIDEVTELFPSRYIHIGGDEAWKENWERCPLCQQRMKDNNLPNEEELQSYFLRRINRYILSKGRSIMGWDELTESEIPEKATIFGWRGMGEAAVHAAEKGFPVVLTPAKIMYLIRYQGPQWFEPFTYFGNNTLKDVFDYRIEDSGFTSAYESSVLGLQASMWTEFIRSDQELEYMILPRLGALAENAWCRQKGSWTNFVERTEKNMQLFEFAGVNYARSLYNLFHKVTADTSGFTVKLHSEHPQVQIRYTTDGTVPTASSSLSYQTPVRLSDGQILLAATFMGTERKGQILKLNPTRTLSTGGRVIGNEINGLLTNGLLGSERYSDGEYVDFYDSDAEFTVDMHTLRRVSSIELGTVINAGMGAQYPEKITVLHSSDGIRFEPLLEKQFAEKDRFVSIFSKESIRFEGFAPLDCRYLRFQILKPGICPEGHPREGQPGRMSFDELMVR